jgi:hypothetical protein
VHYLPGLLDGEVDRAGEILKVDPVAAVRRLGLLECLEHPLVLRVVLRAVVEPPLRERRPADGRASGRPVDESAVRDVLAAVTVDETTTPDGPATEDPCAAVEAYRCAWSIAACRDWM